jgi:lipopolysaccharide transport system ATP-binding protein
MSDVVIRAENLGKKYTIGHAAQRERYIALRDVIAREIRSGLRKFKDVIHGRSVVEGDELEEVWALRGVGFEARRGELIGVIGRNGAGKSTLLKILSRITEPTEGQVAIKGRVSALLEVGSGFHSELTGRENVYLNGAILGMSRAEIRKKFDEIVAFAEVEKFLDTPVKRYSSGMYMRLAFSVAAHLEPDILIVDEVLAVGDAQFQRKCLGKIENVTSRDHRTVLVVSHNMALVSNLCDRVLVLEQGRVAFAGPTSPGVECYLNQGGEHHGEVVWPELEGAPGNETVRFHAVRILQPDSPHAKGEVDISKETLIQIQYWNLEPGAKLYVALWLADKSGTVVLASSNHASVTDGRDEWNGRPHPPGLYSTQCAIPANFLNEGRYLVTAIVGRDPFQTLIMKEWVVSFTVHDTGTMRQEYLGRWIGVVRPRLAWMTEARPS